MSELEKGTEIKVPKVTQLSVSEEQEVGVSSLTDVMTTATLRKGVKAATDQREIIIKYVKEHLKEGSDFGKIGSFSKSVLFKPGQEKIFSLMNLTSRLEKDTDTIEMLGNEKGVIAYICRVYRGGVEVAQGRGAAKVGEMKRDINSTIKIAEKRARMDACLSLGFSEFFTQDLDDPEYRNNATADAPATSPKDSKQNPATQKQRDYIKSLIKELLASRDTVSGNYIKALYMENGVADPVNMTFEEASNFISALKDGKATLPDDNGNDDPTPPVEPQESPKDDIIEGEVVEPAKENVAENAEDRLAVAKTYLIDECEFSEADADLLIEYWSGVTGSNPRDELAVKRVENTIKAVNKKFIKEALEKAKEAKGVKA